MRQITKFAALSTLSAVLFTGGAFAQDHNDDHHDNHTYVRHNEWKKGYHMKDEDWKRGDEVDYLYLSPRRSRHTAMSGARSMAIMFWRPSRPALSLQSRRCIGGGTLGLWSADQWEWPRFGGASNLATASRVSAGSGPSPILGSW